MTIFSEILRERMAEGLLTARTPATVTNLVQPAPAPPDSPVPAAPFRPAPAPGNQFAIAFIKDYNALPEYLRMDYPADADGYTIGTGTPKPYATIWGQQIGLDNNYNYAIYPNGAIHYIFYGYDPYYDPNIASPITVGGLREYSVPVAQGVAPGTVMTTVELMLRYGFNPATAARDPHGYPIPGDMGGLRWAPYTNPGIHGGSFFFDTFLPQLAFSLMTMGVGALASVGTAVEVVEGAAALTEGGVALETIDVAAGAVDTADVATTVIASEPLPVGQFDDLSFADFGEEFSTMDVVPMDTDFSIADAGAVVDAPYEPDFPIDAEAGAPAYEPDFPVDANAGTAPYEPDFPVDPNAGDADAIVRKELADSGLDLNDPALRAVGKTILQNVFKQEISRGATPATATKRAQAQVRAAYAARAARAPARRSGTSILAPGFATDPYSTDPYGVDPFGAPIDSVPETGPKKGAVILGALALLYALSH